MIIPTTADAVTSPQLSARQRIIESALTLFLRDGYTATSVAAIAAEAETSRATFYTHFTSKADLLAEFVDRFVEEAMALFTDFAQLPDTTEPSLKRWMTTVVSLWERDAQLIRLILGNRAEDTISIEQARTERAVDLVTRNPNHWAELTLREVRARAFVLVVSLRQALADWATFDWPLTADDMVETLTEIWFQTLHPHQGSK